jgi:hypothetical protein
LPFDGGQRGVEFVAGGECHLSPLRSEEFLLPQFREQRVCHGDLHSYHQSAYDASMKQTPPQKPLTAAEIGRLGGLSKSKKKIAAVLKNLKKANKQRQLTKRLA